MPPELYPLLIPLPAPEVISFIDLRYGWRKKIKGWSDQRKRDVLRRLEKATYPKKLKKAKEIPSVGKLTPISMLAAKVELKKALGIKKLGNTVRERIAERYPGYPYEDWMEFFESLEKLPRRVKEFIRRRMRGSRLKSEEVIKK